MRDNPLLCDIFVPRVESDAAIAVHQLLWRFFVGSSRVFFAHDMDFVPVYSPAGDVTVSLEEAQTGSIAAALEQIALRRIRGGR